MNYILAVILTLVVGKAIGQFTESAESYGISIVHEETEYGNGLSFYDFNHDGWDDLSFADGDGVPRFFVNEGGQLNPVAFNLDIDPVAHIVMLLWADIDNDGDSDLLSTQLEGPAQLWENDGAFNFTDISQSAGIMAGNWRHRGAAFADYDHDGYLDLFIAKYYIYLNDSNSDYESKLYHNNGDNTFTDVTISAGVDLITSPTFQPVFFDYDNDGWEDLYLVIDRNFWMNRLFHNNGNGTFTDVSTTAGANPSIDAMSGTIGDYDNDLDLDIFVSNGWPGNHLYENLGNGTFSNNIASSAGVMIQMICWGALWLDYNNDSWNDLYVGTTGNYFGAAQSHFFINNHDDTFSPADSITSINDHIAAVMVVAKGDLNRDGYYDFATNSNDPFPSELWMNDGGENHFLAVSLEGTVSNRDGIGAWIHCFAGGHQYVQFTRSGDNFNSQSSGNYIFGLDNVDHIDSLKIAWNSGLTETYYDFPSDQFLHLVEGQSIMQPYELSESDVVLICEGDSLTLDAGVFDSYLWNTGDTTRFINVFFPGQYYVDVQTELGVSNFSMPLNVEFYELPELLFDIQHESCPGTHDGIVSVEIPEDPAFSMIWEESDTTAIFEGLGQGIYSYEVYTSEGCYLSGTAEVLAPLPLSFDVEINAVTCFGADDGQAIINLVDTTDVIVFWNDGVQGFYRDQLSDGEYTFNGLDAYGCPFSGAALVESPTELIVSAFTTDVTCYGLTDGMASLEVSGGIPPYEVLWNDLDSLSLAAGDYYITILDSADCAETLIIQITQPDPLSVELFTNPEFENELLGNATINTSGGTPPYDYSAESATPGFYDQLEAGNYVITITDYNGCSIDTTYTIDFVASIYEQSGGREVLYPNPGEDIICVSVALTDVHVLSAAGIEVGVRPSLPCMEIASLPAGKYHLTGRDAFGVMRFFTFVKK